MKHKVFVIAEAGVNHDGIVADALRLVDAAADVGADAVKFQTFRADDVATPSAPQADYQGQNLGRSENQAEMLRRLELSVDAHFKISERCKLRGIEFMSTAFDDSSLKFLISEIGLGRIKIPSGEITNPLLLAAAACAGLPIIVSTGMCTVEDVEDGLGMLAFFVANGRNARGGRSDFRAAFASYAGRTWMQKTVALLHCTSEYPTPIERANLHAIRTLSDHFGLTVGYSDHTLGQIAPLAAVALGARVIEKHITLSAERIGPDHKASMEIADFSKLVRDIRLLERALGDGSKRPTAAELSIRAIVRRGLFASRDLPAGHVIRPDDVQLLRPMTSIDARDYWSVVGRSLRTRCAKGSPIETGF